MKKIKIIGFLLITSFTVESVINKENGIINKFIIKNSRDFVQSLKSYENIELTEKTKIKTEYRYKIIAPKREYSRRVWVEAKTLKECMNGSKTVNNNTVKCTNGYYKEIRVIE